MPSPDLLSLFAIPLNRLDIPYMATGAVAAIAYSTPRLTNDIGLVVKLRATDAGRLVGEFDPSQFDVPPVEVIADEIRRPRHGHFNLIHLDTGLRADIYLVGSDPLHLWAFARRYSEAAGEGILWLAPIEYVIVRKLQFFRDGSSEKHLRDIEQMLRVSGPRIQRDDLAGLIQENRLESEWTRITGSFAL